MVSQNSKNNKPGVCFYEFGDATYGSILTLFRMGGKKPPPSTSASPVTFPNVGISPQIFGLLPHFRAFCRTSVKLQEHT